MCSARIRSHENCGFARSVSKLSGGFGPSGGADHCRSEPPGSRPQTARIRSQIKNLAGLRRVEAGTNESETLVIRHMEGTQSPLLHVCRLLNEQRAEYLIVGAWAMILNSVVRATEDVDILVADNRENFQKVIDALSLLADGAARELTPKDFEENIVIKIADEVEVDVSTRAWTVTYAEAFPNALSAEVDGVTVPYLSLPDLIRSKQTHRDQDRVDVELLRRLLP